MQNAADKRLGMEKNLRLSIEKKELVLLYQPQISRYGDVISCESLVRWYHNDKIISPADFIPIAEDTGIIIDIGQWVLNQSCMQFKKWKNLLPKNNKFDHISVNVSPKQFREDNFVDTVKQTLKNHSMDAHELELEITEGIVIANVEETINKMVELKALSIRLAMDDFGTGYSSLSYLKKLPLDILKIDQSFIFDANDDKNDKAIVSTIIAMASKLEMITVAEGIENELILKFLEEEGCNIYQGYYFGRPMPADDFYEFMMNWKGIESIKG